MIDEVPVQTHEVDDVRVYEVDLEQIDTELYDRQVEITRQEALQAPPPMMMGSANSNTQQEDKKTDHQTPKSGSKEGSSGNPQGFNPIAAAESLSLIL